MHHGKDQCCTQQVCLGDMKFFANGQEIMPSQLSHLNPPVDLVELTIDNQKMGNMGKPYSTTLSLPMPTAVQYMCSPSKPKIYMQMAQRPIHSFVPSSMQNPFPGNMFTAKTLSRQSNKPYWQCSNTPADLTQSILAHITLGGRSHSYVPQQFQCGPNPAHWMLDQHHLPGLHTWTTRCNHCWHGPSHSSPHPLPEHGNIKATLPWP